MSDPETAPTTSVPAGKSTPSETSKERRERRGKGEKTRRTRGATFKEPNFTGNTEELKENIYNLIYNMGDRYTTTTRAIAEHAGRTYKNGSMVKASIEELTAMALDVLTDSIVPNALELRI